MSSWPVHNIRRSHNNKHKLTGIRPRNATSWHGLGNNDDCNCTRMSISNKRGLTSRQTSWDEWYKHNMKVTQDLAMLMKAPTGEVAELLYSLTLQNYNNILNPKCMGWNCRYIPFSRLDACDRYLSVFDLQGNLREPRHPKSLILLLEFMQSIIGKPEEEATNESLRSNMDVSLSSRSIAEALATANEKYEELFPNEDSKIYFMYSKRLGRLIDPDVDKITPAIKKRIFIRDDEQVKGNRGVRTYRSIDDAPFHGSSKIRSINSRYQSHRALHGEDFAAMSTSHGRRNNSNRNPHIILPFTPFKSDYLLIDERGRRRGQGSAQLSELRSKRLQFLRHLLHNMRKSDPDGFLKSLGSIDLKNPRSKHKRNKIATEELATFYETVVSDGATKKHGKGHKELTIQDGEPSPPRERKYYGDPIPVLYHAPYKSSDESTWMRRHPGQLRLQDDGRLGVSSVKRYKRDSVQKSLNVAQNRYSIHSLNSQLLLSNKKPEVVFEDVNLKLSKKPEYKRVFTSPSRRFKLAKQSKGH